MGRFHKLDLLIYVFLILAVLGLADSAYLAAAYFSDTPLVCGSIPGCNEVASSPYSNVAGVPLSVMGLLFYAVSIVGAFFYLIKRRTVYATLLALLTMIGFAASAYFIYIQVAIIQALCVYCVGSAIVATLMLIVASIIRGHDIEKHELAEERYEIKQEGLK